MKNLIYQIANQILTQVRNLEKFSIGLRSISLALTFPIAFGHSHPITLPIVKLQNIHSEVTIQSEKLVKIALDFQKPSAVTLVEKNLQIQPSESNFDQEQRLKKEETEKVAQEAKKMAKRNVIAREKPRFASDPALEQKRALVQAAASRHRIPWQVLEAVWQVESGKSWDTNRRSYAGAVGPMQFLPSTYRKYAQNGASIYSASDSVYAAANLLASAGASNGQVERALFAYNHSYSYVQKVLRIAREIGY